MCLKVFRSSFRAGIFSVIGAVLSACGGGGDSTPTSNNPIPPTVNNPTTPAPKYTFLVYMVGSDLESGSGFGTNDLTEMMQVGSNANVKVIVETGGANKEGWRTVKRRLINQGSETELSDLGSLNMGAPGTLQDFIAWGIANYPADKYALVMWDHGSGAIGDPATGTFGNDENSGDALSLLEIKQALQNAYNTTGKKFDVIGFDACLMATLETAYTVSSFANYLVASEELEPGHGWDYTAILSAIKSNTAISGSALGQTIADGFKAHAQTENPDSAPTITLSVTDLSKVQAVITALEGLATSAGANLQNNGQSAWNTIAVGRSKSEDYGNDTQSESFTDMADLKHIAGNLAATYPTEANAVIAAINQAIVYKINGTARPNANGLTIFLPHKNINNPGLADMIQAYSNIDFSPTYQDFIGQYTSLGDQDDTAPTFTGENFTHDTVLYAQTGSALRKPIGSWTPDTPDLDVLILAAKVAAINEAKASGAQTPVFSISDGNVFTAQVQGDDVDRVYAVITQSDPTTGTVLILGLDTADVDAAGNVSYDWTGQWVTMNGNFISLSLEDEEGDISTYSIPALLNGEGVDILVMVDNGTGDYSILGAWPGIQNGIAAREIIAIQDGDEITPLFSSYDLSTDAEQWAQGTAFIVDAAGLELAITPLPPGTYNLGFLAEDYAQNEQNSQFVAAAAPLP